MNRECALCGDLIAVPTSDTDVECVGCTLTRGNQHKSVTGLSWSGPGQPAPPSRSAPAEARGASGSAPGRTSALDSKQGLPETGPYDTETDRSGRTDQ